MKWLLVPIVFFSFLVLILPVSKGVDRMREIAELAPKETYRSVLGFDNIVADIAWIELIQYQGDVRTKMTEETMEKLYRMYDRVTTLDPHFLIAFQYGGLTFLVKKPEYALKILDKGVKNNPQAGWRLPYYAGLVYYYQIIFKKGQDYEGVIKYLEMATKFPDSPSYVQRLLGMAYQGAGRQETALDLWKSIYDAAEVKAERELAKKSLLRLVVRILDVSEDAALREKAKKMGENLTR